MAGPYKDNALARGILVTTSPLTTFHEGLMRILFAFLLFITSNASALAQEMTTTFVGSDGEPKGSATIAPAYNGTLVTVDLAGLPEGWHGIHFHEKGSCDITKEFSTAGDHVTEEGKRHGVMTENGPHQGDLPNVWVNADGTGKAELFTPFVRMGDLQDPNGTALMIHAGPDDYKTQPSGNSGDRIACGPLMKK